jgi:hypothetical protein
MKEEMSQPAPRKKKTGLYIALVVVAAIVIVAVALIVSNPSLLPQSRITQIQIKVEYSGSWQGARGDLSALESWSGTGSKTVTLNRPSDASIWIISANAQKLDDSSNTLRIMITKTDGTVLREGSTTAAYGVAQITYTIQD